jgi:hypothetical protein
MVHFHFSFDDVENTAPGVRGIERDGKFFFRPVGFIVFVKYAATRRHFVINAKIRLRHCFPFPRRFTAFATAWAMRSYQAWRAGFTSYHEAVLSNW